MRLTGVLRVLAVVFTLVTTWLFANTYFSQGHVKSISMRSWPGSGVKPTKKAQPLHNKCKNKNPCPSQTFAFKIISGAANVVGPSMCFEDNILLSTIKNNAGRGINIALVNGTTGRLLVTGAFDMYSGDVKHLLAFLKNIKRGSIVLVASFDDPATKLNDEARTLFSELGSSYASKLGFRDNWVFLGGKGLKNKSPFEQHLKNDKDTNKYEGWPEVLEIEGCVPKKME